MSKTPEIPDDLHKPQRPRTAIFFGYLVAFFSLLVMLPLVWLPALFDEIAVSTEGGATAYSYNVVPWIFFSTATIAFILFGEYLRRKQRDVWGALIFYAGAPLMVFLSLQLAYESVTITPDELIYTREPPHTGYNASIGWDQIAGVTHVRLEAQEILTGRRHFRIGYKLVLRDGAKVELPACDTLSTAAPELDRRFRSLRVPVDTETIPLR